MSNDAEQRLGGLIAEWRRDAGLSQASLADALHTQQATISKMEAGSYRLSVIQLLDILDTCGLSLSDVTVEIETTVRTEGRPLWERIDE